jgi:hypothetical protein
MYEILKRPMFRVDTPPIIRDNEADMLENSMLWFVFKVEER